MTRDLYRRGVGLVLISGEGRTWMGRHRYSSEAYQQGLLNDSYWQWPQGGMEHDETPEEAMFREMEEEIGTRNIQILAQTSWLSYDFPEDIRPRIYEGRFQGQKHIWFLGSLIPGGEGPNIHTEHPEFLDECWMSWSCAASQTIPFKQPVYRQVLQSFSSWIHDKS